MRVYTKEEIEWNGAAIMDAALDGALFIYPTDTIYGFGCNALDTKAVARLKQAKQKPKDSSLSVIVPSKEWVYEHCEVSKEAQRWIDKLPGPYMLILSLKNTNAVSKEVSASGTLAIRIPNHWISGFVRELGVPLVMTSANIHGKMVMTSLESLDHELKKGVNFLMYEGEKWGKPSQTIDVTKVGSPPQENRKKG